MEVTLRAMTPRAHSSKAQAAARSRATARDLPKLLVLVVVTLVLLAGCSSSAPSTATPEPTATSISTAGTDLAVTNPHEATTGTLPEGTATIDKAELPVGTVLVDGTGFVLYTPVSYTHLTLPTKRIV